MAGPSFCGYLKVILFERTTIEKLVKIMAYQF